MEWTRRKRRVEDGQRRRSARDWTDCEQARAIEAWEAYMLLSRSRGCQEECLVEECYVVLGGR